MKEVHDKSLSTSEAIHKEEAFHQGESAQARSHTPQEEPDLLGHVKSADAPQAKAKPSKAKSKAKTKKPPEPLVELPEDADLPDEWRVKPREAGLTDAEIDARWSRMKNWANGANPDSKVHERTERSWRVTWHNWWSRDLEDQRRRGRGGSRDGFYLPNGKVDRMAILESMISDEPDDEAAKPSEEQFERFRAAYPRQEGLEASRETFMALSCEDAEHAISSAAQYADKCRRDRTEERYIKGAQRWISERAFRDYVADRPADYWWRDMPGTKLALLKPEAWRKAVAKYANGTWPVETLGPGPWDPGCLVPQEVIDELGLRVKHPDPTEGALKPDWWRGAKHLHRFEPEFWEMLIARYANGSWPIEYLGYGPWDERCPVPPKVMAKLGLKEKYSTPDNTPACTENANPTEQQFDRFWTEYPRKEDRTLALQVFMTLSPEDAEKAITAAARFAERVRREKRETTRIKLPQNWLSTRGFDDFDDPLGDARRNVERESRRRMEEELEFARTDNL